MTKGTYTFDYGDTPAMAAIVKMYTCGDYPQIWEIGKLRAMG